MRQNQSKLGSLFEAFLGACFAAPSAMGLHYYMLELWGNNLTDEHVKSVFVFISWISFFLHSITWKFILRRIFERCPALEPVNILHRIQGRKNVSL